jgi:hypothetical protein
MAGVPGSSKQKPYAGPMYSEGTKEMDSQKNVGPVHGPVGIGGSVPDVLDYVHDEDKSGGKLRTK